MRFSSINLERERKSSGRFSSFIVLLLEMMLGGPNYFTELRKDHLPREQFSCVCIFTNQSSVAVSWKIPTNHASKPFSTWISKVLKSPLENSVPQIRGSFSISSLSPQQFHVVSFPVRSKLARQVKIYPGKQTELSSFPGVLW